MEKNEEIELKKIIEEKLYKIVLEYLKEVNQLKKEKTKLINKE